MQKQLTIIVIVILCKSINISDAYLVNARPPGQYIWPLPQSLEINQEHYSLDPISFEMLAKSETHCQLLCSAIERYRKLIFVEDCSLKNPMAVETQFEKSINLEQNRYFKGNLKNITVWVKQSCEKIPGPHMDESYEIEISSEKSLISAKSVWGVIRALETFSQIIRNIGLNQFVVNFTKITDRPRFTHRGIMLDTARHYLPVRVLKENLDAMAYNKMNVFHWHMTDDQSFPYVSRVFPNLSLFGAYVPKTHIYTVKDIHEVIEYARVRGIRVVVEFDTPGHTKAWAGQPDLLTQCYKDGEPVIQTDEQLGPINPIRNTTYDFIRKFFTEVMDRFPDKYLHLGADEVDFSCAATNPEFVNYMAANNIENINLLQQIYINKLLDFVKSMNRSYIVWQDVLDEGIDIKPDTVLHIWRDNWKEELFKVTAKGYKAIFSSDWYLNVVTYGPDWKQYYDSDPQDFGGSVQQNALVIGGEACLWGEWLDSSNLISTTWPRAIAVAERLWSSRDVKGYQLAIDRFNVQQCLMQKRGIAVAPVNGQYQTGLSPGYCQCDYA